VGAGSVVVEREDGWWRSAEGRMEDDEGDVEVGRRGTAERGRSPHPNNSKRRGGGNAGDIDNLNKTT
jgi:hypothetical protein